MLYSIPADIKVFGVRVTDFPSGIGEAFDNLRKLVPTDGDREYYGIIYLHEGKMAYMAAIRESYHGEGQQYGCENFIIEKGEYLAKAIHNWPGKTSSIKYIFDELIKDPRVDHEKPAVEFYKNMEEMICLVKARL